ncbi:MAG: hypothetical protein R2932_10580 [Caldilineaceae bacterium]
MAANRKVSAQTNRHRNGSNGEVTVRPDLPAAQQTEQATNKAAPAAIAVPKAPPNIISPEHAEAPTAVAIPQKPVIQPHEHAYQPTVDLQHVVTRRVELIRIGL